MAKQGRKAKRQAAREERAREGALETERKPSRSERESARASQATGEDVPPIELPADESASGVSTSGTSLVLTGTARMLANAFVALFLLYMIAMPLRYYLGGGGHDERFSWRMFSTIRLQQCKGRVFDVLGERAVPVRLEKMLQVAWIGMLERNRPLVVQRVLERRCTEEGVTQARFALACTAPDGSKLPEVRKELDCKTGVLTEESSP
jgi:hypothetical protein